MFSPWSFQLFYLVNHITNSFFFFILNSTQKAKEFATTGVTSKNIPSDVVFIMNTDDIRIKHKAIILIHVWYMYSNFSFLPFPIFNVYS